MLTGRTTSPSADTTISAGENVIHLVPSRVPRTKDVPATNLQRSTFAITAGRRCSTVFAQSAVFLLVGTILDWLLVARHAAAIWLFAAAGAAVVLLAASVACDLLAQRWYERRPFDQIMPVLSKASSRRA